MRLDEQKENASPAANGREISSSINNAPGGNKDRGDGGRGDRAAAVVDVGNEVVSGTVREEEEGARGGSWFDFSLTSVYSGIVQVTKAMILQDSVQIVITY